MAYVLSYRSMMILRWRHVLLRANERCARNAFALAAIASADVRPRSQARKFAAAAKSDIIEAYLSSSNVSLYRRALHITLRYEPHTGPLPLPCHCSMQHQELCM